MTTVVQPVYQAPPNGGHGSFLPSGSRRFNCVRVLATIENGEIVHWRIPTALSPTFGWIRDRYSQIVNSIDITCSNGCLPISTAPAVEPAITERRALGYCVVSQRPTTGIVEEGLLALSFVAISSHPHDVLEARSRFPTDVWSL